MSAIKVPVDEAHDGATLAAVVRDSLSAATGEAIAWSRARDLCHTGRVVLDGAIARDAAQRVRAGMCVEIAPTAPKRTEGVLPRDAVIHLDADVIVVSKPAGVVTVPFEPGERDTLVDRVRALIARIEKGKPGGRDPMVGVVQRLDKDTTGAMVFARTMSAKRSLEEQLRVHSVERRYRAIAHGDVPSARHETWLVQDRGDGMRGSWGRFRGHVGEPPESAKRAVTYVQRLEPLRDASGTKATLVECRLETGRQHQIRIHLSEAGHSLLGEPVYIREHVGPKIAAPRPMLHAAVLGFVHPRTQRTVRFEDPLPADFEDCLARLRR